MNPIEIGKFIAACRREQGLTQQQLADRLNLSNKTISKWESGGGSPDLGNLVELARALDLTVDEILQAQRKPEPPQAPAQEPDPSRARGFALLGAAIGAILGILAYNYGWLG